MYSFLLFALMLTSCALQQPVSTNIAENNKDYQVAYLFEHDGCKVYRFLDNGTYVYFTNVRSDVTIVPSDTTVVLNTVRELKQIEE